MKTLKSRARPRERCPGDLSCIRFQILVHCIEAHLRVESGRHPAPSTLSETSETLMNVKTTI